MNGLTGTLLNDCTVNLQICTARYRRLDLTPERRTRLGFQCKRLLDMGRVARLRGAGFESQLVRFVPESVSPENVALLAVSRRHAFDNRITAGLLSQKSVLKSSPPPSMKTTERGMIWNGSVVR